MAGQILSISGMNIKNIPSRWSSSLVVVIGIGGVVAVLVAMLAMAVGLANVFTNSIGADRAVVARSGSDSELSSNLDSDTGRIISTLEGVAVASPELYVVADVPKKATGTPANVVLRGVEPQAFDIRPNLKIVEGRNFEPGRNEVIVGTKAQLEFDNLELGDVMVVRESTWEVVGVFEADGAVEESEIWGDLTSVQGAYRFGQSISIVRLLLDSEAQLSNLQALVEDDPRLPVDVILEQDWFSRQSEQSTQVIRIFGILVAVVMSIGAIFAALNTMYSAVAARTFEIATLRAIGFRSGPILFSVLAEALVLALIGGAIGAAISFFAFNGFTVSTLNQATFSQIAFEFMVTPELVTQGLVLSLGLGFVGGLFPAVRATRLPVTVALRGE